MKNPTLWLPQGWRKRNMMCFLILTYSTPYLFLVELVVKSLHKKQTNKQTNNTTQHNTTQQNKQPGGLRNDLNHSAHGVNDGAVTGSMNKVAEKSI